MTFESDDIRSGGGLFLVDARLSFRVHIPRVLRPARREPTTVVPLVHSSFPVHFDR